MFLPSSQGILRLQVWETSLGCATRWTSERLWRATKGDKNWGQRQSHGSESPRHLLVPSSPSYTLMTRATKSQCPAFYIWLGYLTTCKLGDKPSELGAHPNSTLYIASFHPRSQLHLHSLDILHRNALHWRPCSFPMALKTNKHKHLSLPFSMCCPSLDMVCEDLPWTGTKIHLLMKEVLYAHFRKPMVNILICLCFMHRFQKWCDCKNTVSQVLYKMHHTQLCVDESNLWLISISGSPLRCITKRLQDLFPWQQQHHTGKRMESVQRASLEIATKMHTQLRRLKTNLRALHLGLKKNLFYLKYIL